MITRLHHLLGRDRPVVIAFLTGLIVALALGGAYIGLHTLLSGRTTRLAASHSVCQQVNLQTKVIRHLVAFDLPASPRERRQVNALKYIDCRDTRAQ